MRKSVRVILILAVLLVATIAATPHLGGACWPEFPTQDPCKD